MNEEWTEDDLRKLAAQLRKPEGDAGYEVAGAMNEGNAAMNLHTLAVVNPQPGESILEIGMAKGFFVKHILGIDSSIRYTGCDYSQEMVDMAMQLNSKFVDQERADFIHAKIDSLPFDNQSFDKIFTINTYYFWDDYDVTVQELKRLLKPGGKFILSVRPKEVMETYSVTRYGFNMHENDEIISLLQRHGFQFIETTTVKEPDQDAFNMNRERVSVMFSCRLEN